MRLGSRLHPAVVVLCSVLTALLAITVLPPLASPAHAATVTVTGKVTGPNASGAQVAVADVFVEALDATGRTFDTRIYAYTADDGTYRLTLPATGTYQFEIECWGDYPCAADYAPEPRVTRTLTADTTLNATLDRWATVKGTITRSGVRSTWPGATVEARNDAREWSSYPGVAVAADGTFTLAKVAPGTVTFSADDPTNPPTYQVAGGQSFTVGAGSTTNVSLAIEPWRGVALRAVDPSGNPLSMVAWDLYSRSPGGAWDDGLQYGPKVTDASGRMEYPPTVQAGKEYTVCFFDDVYADHWSAGPTRANRHASRCWGGSPDLAGATAWTPTAAQPSLKGDVVMPVAGKAMTPGEPWPTGSGVAAVGTTITIDPGTWGPAGAALAYQWKHWDEAAARWVAITGATTASYTPTAAMSGKRIGVFVTGTATGYAPVTRTWFSEVGAAAPTMTGAPVITGTLAVGSTATVTPGTYTPATASTSIAWYLDGRPIIGGQDSSIQVTAAMQGKRLEARIKAHDWERGENTHHSRVSKVVPGVLTAATPTISGTKAVGSTLTANPGTWQPSGVTFTYQWYRSGVAISGATASTYRLTATDGGKTMTVRVTGSRSGYASKSATSAATSAVLKQFTTAPLPTISGTRRVASTLTAALGTWSPTPTGTAYRWYRNGVAITGATARSYKLTSTDRGKQITVRVTRSLAGYVTTARLSAATAAIG